MQTYNNIHNYKMRRVYRAVEKTVTQRFDCAHATQLITVYPHDDRVLAGISEVLDCIGTGVKAVKVRGRQPVLRCL